MARIARRGDAPALNSGGQDLSTAAHLAPGPALGYVYQFQVALLKLVPYAMRHEEAYVQLEVLDDVSLGFSDNKPPQIVQVHSEAADRPLTDKNPKVWKTLGIWSREFAHGDMGKSELVLFSTQTAAEGSGVSLLRDNGRQPDQAATHLEEVATDAGGADTTAPDRSSFLELNEAQRRSLLARVVVVDSATSPLDMHHELVDVLMPTHEAQFVEDMAKAVEGWWWGRLPSALQDGTAIGSEELRAQIDSARRRLSDASLPLVRSLEDLEEQDLPEGDQEDDQFLACLDEIRASLQRRQIAVNDYRLAFAHRSRWTREGLVGLEEIGLYEDRLVGHWAIGCDGMLRHLDEEPDDDTKASAGHDLWDEMEAGGFPPIRAETVEPFIQKGSFHQLANDERVSWHPDAAGPIYNEMDQS